MSHCRNLALVLATALLVPVQAHALRCEAPPQPTDVVNAAHLSPNHSVVGYGTFLGVSPPPNTTRGLPLAHYEFRGVLFRDGAAVSVDPGTVITSTSCKRDIWCHHSPLLFKQGQEYLVVFGQNPKTGDLGVHAGLCRSSTFLALDNANLSKIAACVASGMCTQADFGPQD